MKYCNMLFEQYYDLTSMNEKALMSFQIKHCEEKMQPFYSTQDCFIPHGNKKYVNQRPK